MKKHTFTNYVREARIWLRPLGVDAPDMMFKVFEYASFEDYADAVQSWLSDLGDNYGLMVEEAEAVDWDYIPDNAISDGYVEGITADGWEAAKIICEKAEELNLNPKDIGEIVEEHVDDVRDLERWWDDHVIGRMTIQEYAQELVADGAVDFLTFFDYDSFGNDLKMGGDISQLVEELGTEAAQEETEYMSNEELAMWYLDQSGLELRDLGEQTLKDHFDMFTFANDLRNDVWQYGSDANPILIRA